MEGHQRNLYLYDRYNARVTGVSRDNIETLRYWAAELDLEFPLLSNPVGHVGQEFGALEEGAPFFSRVTAIIDKWGVLRYLRRGSPDYQEILLTLKTLHAEEERR
jgi:peroxiredoxin Q/BCP